MILKGLFMIAMTILLYIVAKKLQDKYKHPLLNPALIASIAVIAILVIVGADYDDYMSGGKWINYLLNCTVVCLAFPLYQNRQKILKYAKVIFTSVIAGVMLNFTLVFFSLKILGYQKEDIVTLLPRSMTAAVGVQVSKQLGGEDTITIVFIIATGLIGSILGSYFLKMGKFKTSIARGLTYGNASHAFGTAKALEMDRESGAFSSIGMILTALLSSIVLPILILFFY